MGYLALMLVCFASCVCCDLMLRVFFAQLGVHGSAATGTPGHLEVTDPGSLLDAIEVTSCL